MADPFAKTDTTDAAPKKVVRKKRKYTRRKKQQVKRGSKLSLTFFAVGCGLFLLLFAGMVFGGVARVLNDPTILTNSGMDIATVKQILQLFVWLIIWLFGLWLLFSVFLTIYRLATVKTGKIRYLIGMIVSIISLVGLVIAWYYVLNEISKLNAETNVSSLPVISYIETRDGQIMVEKWIPLIAPFNLSFQLNQTVRQNQVSRNMGISQTDASKVTVTLDCGNGQELSLGSNGYFVGKCLYMEKKEYSLKMNVTAGSKKDSFNAGVFVPNAVIEVDSLDDEPRFNDALDEWILGTAPVNTRFRSQLLFSDLKLPDEQISWDFDNDGNVDLEDNTQFQRTFADSKLHTIAYQLPGIPKRGKTRYVFDLRVVESDLAVCTLEYENIQDNTYGIKPRFDEQLTVSDYKYTIYDTASQQNVDSPKPNAKWQVTYTFPEWANYEVLMSYTTPEKKKWSCRPIQINVWYDGNQAEFTLFWQHEVTDSFREVTTQTTEVELEDDTIFVNQVPTTIQLRIDRIIPDESAEATIYYENKELFVDNGVVEFTVNKVWETQLDIQILNDDGDESNQEYLVSTSRNTVNARIEVLQGAVGEDPLEVILDASISDIYDEDDEIVFFSWDFGDGQTRPKVSQGKIEHVYTFDTDNNRWEYYPKVVVQTRKWLTDEYIVSEPIVVKRKQKTAEIRVDSHPTQQANIGERISFSVLTDGLVDKIEWDFGNFKSLSCDGRECSTTAMSYDEKGIYEVTAEVSYEDNIPAIAKIRVQVY